MRFSALVSTGPKALPYYIQRLNQSLSNELDPLRYARTFRSRNCVLAAAGNSAGDRQNFVIYSGKVHAVDLSRTDLSQTVTDSATFTLVVDKIDLSGIQLSAANLNKASFRSSRLRGLGADGRWDTADDWIADLVTPR